MRFRKFSFQEWTKGSLFPLTLHRAVESTWRQGEPKGAAAHPLMDLPGAGRDTELSAHSHPPAGCLLPSAPASDGGDQLHCQLFPHSQMQAEIADVH